MEKEATRVPELSSRDGGTGGLGGFSRPPDIFEKIDLLREESIQLQVKVTSRAVPSPPILKIFCRLCLRNIEKGSYLNLLHSTLN